jgi:transposase
MPARNAQVKRKSRRTYTEEFKRDAVQLLLDGHSAASVAERLGLSGANVLLSVGRQNQPAIGR